jgi:hypothetical protein
LRKILVTGGRTYMTVDVNAKGPEFVVKALIKVIPFTDFNADNDPHRNHDFVQARGREALLEDRLV